ncbi:unnamed protein product [Protopolystoma xenopodis]|uniref:Uncharacterized protein n=1 Tax=Protopolystoma xenopodis TaxID=117903 RepID=A0A3S5APX0_9PLAT|nr:unnamed protein product [Protopolystoma xenopodis]
MIALDIIKISSSLTLLSFAFIQANGHGTVVISPNTVKCLSKLPDISFFSYPELISKFEHTSSGSDAVSSFLQQEESEPTHCSSTLASGRAHPLSVFASLLNTVVGDALADILLIEYLLALRFLQTEDPRTGDENKEYCQLSAWLAAGGDYTELPSFQIKVALPEPGRILTEDAERRVNSPSALQVSVI